MYLDKLNKQERKDILKRTEYILDSCFVLPTCTADASF